MAYANAQLLAACLQPGHQRSLDLLELHEFVECRYSYAAHQVPQT
jgi:hypothetical protein